MPRGTSSPPVDRRGRGTGRGLDRPCRAWRPTASGNNPASLHTVGIRPRSALRHCGHPTPATCPRRYPSAAATPRWPRPTGPLPQTGRSSPDATSPHCPLPRPARPRQTRPPAKCGTAAPRPARNTTQPKGTIQRSIDEQWSCVVPDTSRVVRQTHQQQHILTRRIDLVQHQIDQHAGNRHVQPNWKSPTGNPDMTRQLSPPREINGCHGHERHRRCQQDVRN